MTNKNSNPRIGLISSYAPNKDSFAQVMMPNVIPNCPGVNFIRIGCKGSNADYVLDFSSFSFKKELEKIISKENLDMLHIHYIPPLFGTNLNLLSVYNLNIPIITQLHEIQKLTEKGFLAFIKYKILSIVQKKIVDNSAKVIVHTPGQMSYLKEKYNAENIEVIYVGLHLKDVQPKKKKKILFFGLISPKKGIEYLIEAMDLLKEYGLVIAGSTPDANCKRQLSKIRKIRDESKAKDRIKIVTDTWITNTLKDSLFRNTGIIVVPYIWGPYNSGLVQDAAEYKLPIVITKVGTIFEAVKNFKMGEVVSPNSAQSISKGVIKVYNNYQYYQKGIEKYRNEASWAVHGKKLYALYKKILIN